MSKQTLNKLPPIGKPALVSRLLCIAVLVGLSIVGWWNVRVDSSLEPLLPGTSDAAGMLAFLRDSTFSTKAVLWLHLPVNEQSENSVRDENEDLPKLLDVANQIEAKLDPALVTGVMRPPREADAIEEAMGLLGHVGELLSEDALAQVEQKLTPDALKKRMRENYMQLMKPEGMFFQSIIRKDPLGISTVALTRLQQLTKDMSYRVEIKHGRFVHTDNKQLMLVLETTSSAMSLDGSAALTAHLAELTSFAKTKGVIAKPIAGQIHTAQNHSTMEWDMQRAALINTIAFLLIFILVIQRDWSVVAVFILPLVTVFTTLGLCALLFDKISLVVIGMTTTMVGSAVDYGLFVYIARVLNPTNDPVADMRRVRKTLLTTHIMALGVFASFFFSDIPAYRQLGVLTTVSLVLSLLASLFILPLVLGHKPPAKKLPAGPDLRQWGRRTWPIALVAYLLVPVMIWLTAGLGFDSDLSRFDGISDEVRQNEKDFHHTWSRSETDMAMLVVQATTLNEAQAASDRIYEKANGNLPNGSYVSMSSFWPSQKTRLANLQRWKIFWSTQRIEKLKVDFAAAGEPYGFSAKAFSPFFASIENPVPGPPPEKILESIGKQFTARAGTDWQMVNYFQDTPENVAAARALIRDEPGALVVSRMALNETFISTALSEVKLMAGISIAFIFVSLIVVARGPIRAILIISPAIIGMLAMLSVMYLMNIPVNVVTIVAGIVVLAVSIDYGVFTRHAWQGRETLFGQGMAAVHLASWITLIATGSLLIADHPVMFIVGVSLTTGLGASYFTSILVMPGVYDLVERFEAKRNRKKVTS